MIRSAKSAQGSRTDSGFTLIELMVAMALSLLVVVAATSMFLASRQVFTTNDSSQQVQDSSRFAMYIVRRLAQQAGFQDYGSSTTTVAFRNEVDPTTIDPDVQGFNNSRAGGNLDHGVNGRGAPGGSDVLIVRFQGKGKPGPNETTDPDGSMINCAGIGIPTPIVPTDRSVNVMYVNTGPGGEPELYCKYLAGTGLWAAPQPLVSGVETFQVIYGVDTNNDSVIDRYRRADELTTNAQWQQVRAIRIGMVVRGPVGSAPAGTPATFLYPLGDVATGSAADPGTIFNAPADGRARRVVNFTIHLRNYQGV